jgi:outer membrane protein assembly factor BamB
MCVVLIAFSVAPGRLVFGQWPQWGGPNRDFVAPSAKLADKWPDVGPKTLWTRDIGEGYSSIVVDDGVLYTLCHKDGKELVIAFEAATGNPLWEHAYDAKPFAGMDPSFGPGPRGTPLVAGDKVYSVGVGAAMHCLDKKTGKVVWSHDLQSEYGATALFWGYASSPIAYKNTIIVPVGGEGHGVMAFNAETGEVAWSAQDFKNAYAAPVIINVDGQDQLVAFVSGEIVGLDPNDGRMLWRHAHKTAYDVNASTPIWGDDNILFIASAYGTGARGLKLTRSGDATNVTEMWHQKKMGIHFGTAIRIGDYVYGSIGDNGPTFFAAINVKTGELAWRERGVVAKASGVLADGKLVLIDEDGNLALTTVTPEGVTVHSKFQLFDGRAWTAPTIVGNVLYARDLKTIKALDLG